MDFIVLDGTTEEILQVQQNGFLSISNKSANFKLVSAVDDHSHWLLKSYLNYGYIEVVTLSTEPNITISYVKDTKNSFNN